MKIVVCLRRGLDGELGPFDAAAYEAALRIPEGEVTLLSMGTPETADLLRRLTRLGAKSAVLLSDKAFAGADTLATAYALNCALKKLQPDLVFCGRQTMVGDTAQTGPMLAYMAGMNLITNVMSLTEDLTCTTRTAATQRITPPALLTFERIFDLRLPRLRSKEGTVETWSATDIGADPAKCGLAGSPTRVIKTYENESGKRKCRFIRPDELKDAIEAGLKKNQERITPTVSEQKLPKVVIVGEAPRGYAESVSEDITEWALTDAKDIAAKIKEFRPNAVLWGSDAKSKRIAAEVAAELNLGLCADCTRCGDTAKQRAAHVCNTLADELGIRAVAVSRHTVGDDAREKRLDSRKNRNRNCIGDNRLHKTDIKSGQTERRKVSAYGVEIPYRIYGQIEKLYRENSNYNRDKRAGDKLIYLRPYNQNCERKCTDSDRPEIYR